MFNGRDLTGWKVAGDSGSFPVQDGAIRAKSINLPAYLYWTDGEAAAKTLQSFELTFQARSEGAQANSGIYFHLAEEMRFSRHPEEGHEINLATSGEGDQAIGGLYAVEAPRFIRRDTDDWFHVRILVQGKRVQCWFDGEQTLDYSEPDNLSPASPHEDGRISPVGGGIAIQANSRAGAWYFKNLRIRDLNSNLQSSEDSPGSGQWIDLQNGPDLSGWDGPNLSSWRIENGELWHTRGGKGGTITMPLPFSDRNLEIEGEFRTNPDGNGGVFIENIAELALSGSLDKGHGGVRTGGVFADDGKANVALAAPPPAI